MRLCLQFYDAMVQANSCLGLLTPSYFVVDVAAIAAHAILSKTLEK